MNEALIIISVLAILFSLIALIMGCVAVAMVCGFLRSTHTIQWKTLDSAPSEELPTDLDDPLAEFNDSEVPEINPFKRKKREEPEETLVQQVMEEVTQDSNF